MDYIDAGEVRKAVEILQEPGAVFEVRVLGSVKKESISGYFRDADTMLEACKTINLKNRIMYITIGRVKDECFSRAQSEKFLIGQPSTQDKEIISYRWLFIDFDPERMTGVSSTDEELDKARKLSDLVREYLADLGFCEPVTALSGNGCHLLYRIDIKNDADGRALVEKCLKVLASLFNTDEVKIDTTTYNPARICKLYGTMAQKGRSTKERPHRRARILTVPDSVCITPRETLQKLADELPDDTPPDKRKRKAIQQNEFDVVEFMHEHGMTYREDSNDRAKIFKLDECPFDHTHRDGDAKIFLYHNGAVAFKCHHNSCREYKWQDVRLKFEPDAYDHDDEEDDERITSGWFEHKRVAQGKKPEHKIRKLKSASELMEKDLPDPIAFVGVDNELPLLVEGTCILSAKPKLGKSWFALSLCLAVSSGADFIGYKTRKCSALYLDLETDEVIQQKRLRKALHGDPVPKGFYLESETDTIGAGFIEQIEAYLAEDPSIGVVVIDVFQIIRSPSKSIKETEYEHAYRDITPLNELAQRHHISIILVCHDRKTVDMDDPFANILGSTGLQGAATQMMVMFRRKATDPIHLSVKGKTIDGLPELNLKLEDATWSVVAGVSANQEAEEAKQEYLDSDIREAVLALAREGAWKGQCNRIIDNALDYGIALQETPKMIGGFLHRHVARFYALDGVKIEFVKNGTGPTVYKIYKLTIDTIDEKKLTPFIKFEEPSVYAGLEDWTL